MPDSDLPNLLYKTSDARRGVQAPEPYRVYGEQLAGPRNEAGEVFRKVLPTQLAADLVFGDASFKKVLLFGQINRLRHPRERILHIKLRGKAHALQSAICNVFDILLEAVRVHAEDAGGEYFFCKRVFKHSRFAHEFDNAFAEVIGPEFRVFFFDRVYYFDTEVKVHALVAHDVLDLFCRAGEFVLALKPEHHRKRRIEENTFEDQREDAPVFEEFLFVLEGVHLEVAVEDAFVEAENEFFFVVDRINFTIHVEDL